MNEFKPLKYSETITEESNVVEKNGILELAKAFLSIEGMTHKKLQKLCYYAKAWYLAINDENLINDNFEAWIHGAVQPELYQKYKAFGYQAIPMYTGSIANIPETFLSFAREVFSIYGKYSGDELEKINHQEKPWLNARKNLKPWESSNTIISEKDMKEYCRSLMENE